MFCQVYTRSVIDPLPPPESGSKADKQKKKGGKMTDEEIMDKLSTCNTRALNEDPFQAELHVSMADGYFPVIFRNYCQRWRS